MANTSDRYVRFEDLRMFAKGRGVVSRTNGLWRLIITDLAHEEKGSGYSGLVLRSTQTQERMVDAYEAGNHVLEVSVASLKAARQKVFENMVHGYGRWTHELFTEWVDSL